MPRPSGPAAGAFLGRVPPLFVYRWSWPNWPRWPVHPRTRAPPGSVGAPGVLTWVGKCSFLQGPERPKKGRAWGRWRILPTAARYSEWNRMGNGSLCFLSFSASGASVVAIDNKIEQAMVSEWHPHVIPIPRLSYCTAYVTLGRTD